MAFGSKRKLVDQNDDREAEADEVDLDNSGDEQNSADGAPDEEDESAEHGTAKAAKSLLDEVHKHIFWSPCVVRTLNLVFKDFGNNFAWMVDTYQTPKAIVKYFRNHQHFLNLFRGNSELDLLKVSKTRFASHYILLKRLMDVREALTTTVVTSKWKDLVKACDAQTRAAANVIGQNIMDETFWDEIKIILGITKPLYMVIKFSDGEGPKAGDIYEKMDNMLGELQVVMTKEDNPHMDDWPEVENIILERWGKMN
ncbi:hypothetical protein ACQ4PT_016835 [Festuca glaucescens]